MALTPATAVAACPAGLRCELVIAGRPVAAEQAIRTEGLMIDPACTVKALAPVPRYSGGENVVFWHTGGLLDAVAAGTAEGRP